jgi:hypothetical protein
MARQSQALKVQKFHQGNVPTKQGREQQDKIIHAGFRVLAKESHPGHGGSTEEMQRLNAARDELKFDQRKTVVIDWWKQEPLKRA